MDNLLLFVYIVGDPEGFDFGIRNGECGMKKREAESHIGSRLNAQGSKEGLRRLGANWHGAQSIGHGA